MLLNTVLLRIFNKIKEVENEIPSISNVVKKPGDFVNKEQEVEKNRCFGEVRLKKKRNK